MEPLAVGYWGSAMVALMAGGSALWMVNIRAGGLDSILVACMVGKWERGSVANLGCRRGNLDGCGYECGWTVGWRLGCCSGWQAGRREGLRVGLRDRGLFIRLS
jgi:hypothetical protein